MSNINGINESSVVKFIAAYTTASLRLKVDKWQQMLDNADYQAVLLEWMNSDKHQTLIMTLNASGTLIPTLSINEVLFTNIANGTVKSKNKRQLTASSGKLMPTALLSSVPQTAPFASGNVTTTLSRGPTHGKCLYFIKQHLNINLKTQQQDFRNHIIYGDFPLHHILNTLAHYFEEIIQPLLIQNRTNRKLWPDPVNHDLEKSVRYITNTLIEIRSKVNNQTILSLHSGLEAIRGNVQLRESGGSQTTVEPSMRPLLEEIIIDWILKMNQIVKQTSEYSINLKTNRKNIIHVCLPVHEVNYWLSRRQNLEHLYEQLLNPIHKEVILLLKGFSSTYYPIFLKLYQQLVQAIQEARDNSLWLYPLLLQTTAFTSIQFINAEKLILPLIHCLHLIWVNASYYQSTTRMTTLLRCCYNFMVFRAEEDLDITSLFSLDAEESLRKISKTLQILEYFRSCIMEYKIKYSTKSSSSGSAGVESPPHIWQFSESEVFHSTMETYMQQLFELKQIFEAATSFLQLEKLEIGGYRGKLLTKHIKQLYVGFKTTFEKLCQWKAYPIRSHNSASSATLYNESRLFFHHSHILEKTLSNILKQAFTDCRDWEQLSKLTLMFKNILQRDAICQEIRMVLTHILCVYDEELRIIESNSHVVSEELTCIEDIRHVMTPEFYNFPPVIVALMWLENLLKKGCELEKPEMHILINKLLDANSDLSAQYQMLISRQHTLLSKFENFKLNIFNHWFEGIEECLTRGLNANVWTLSHNGSNENINTADNGEDLKQLDVNLVSDLFQTLLETKYLLAMQNISVASKAITLSQRAVDLKQKLPSALLNLYQHSDEFWQYKVKLLKTAQYYNAIQEKIIVDKKLKLISTQVECIDSYVEQATERIKWKNYDDQFIDDILLKCYQLYETIETTQSNLDSIVSSIRCWSQEPLHQRSLFGARKFFNLGDQKERCKPRLLLCEESMLLLKRMLEHNFRLFLSQSDNFDFGNVPAFQQLLSALKDEQKTNIYKYLDNVCDIICEEVLGGMCISLQFILSEITKRMQTYSETKLKEKITGNISTALQTLTALPMKKDGENLSSISVNSPLCDTYLPKKTATPSKQTLIEVQLNLISNEIGFEPSFEENIQNNFHDIFEALFRDISYTSTYFLELVDKNVFSNYMKNHNESRSKPRHIAEVIREMYKGGEKQEESLDMNDIKQLMDTIRASIRKTANAAKAFALEFKVYSHLWIEKYGKSSCDRSHDIGIKQKNTPRHVVDGIKQIIDKYNGIHENISKLEELQCINGWLAVNIKPFKYTLLNLTCKWINYYKKRLLRYIKRALEKFDDFIYNGSNLLQLHISRDDLGILLQMLHIIIQIREREGRADNLFKASKDAVTLLKTYGFNYTLEILQKINQLILQWNQLKMIAATKLGMIQENKLYQQQQISTRIQMYGCYVQSFHKRFQRMPFFKVPCRDVYVLCDKICIQLRRYLKIKDSIMYCAKLLDIETPKFTILQTCEMQLKNIKHLWDFVYTFESRVEHWHSSAWLKIDTDDIESDCKQFTRDLRTLDKTVRNWTPYLYVTALVKETNSSIRLINDLQNPALKEHHWMKLMKTIKLTKIHSIDYLISLKQDANTKLHQLLSLDLYKFEEDIKNALDCAVKEMAVTKVLDDIDSTWLNMEFGAELHDRRNEVQLLKISTEFIEVLDDNQMQLQNISVSNHGEPILNKIHHWQTVLTKIDSFITIWFEVQRKWCYLEKIFIGSLDIKNQLHEEAIYFQEIDDTFIKLLQEIVTAHKAINVVLEHKHVFDLLDELQQRLVHSEKALYTYLESKRLVFPRFYFISSTDLLDILSNGNLSQTMDRHLIKLFDSILRLSYKKETPSQAIAMISKENNEYVRFVSDHVECSGKVELWLETLKKEMRNTLHGLFGNALQAVCGQQARELWIFDWPAQVALCCSQICWTTEVNRAFVLLESGYEASMKDLHRRQICQLNTLINLLLGELTPGDRQKIMTICTIDVHSRDVINKIICNEVSNPLAFPWQSQLRHRWDFTEHIKNDQNIPESSYDFKQDCFANICDAEFQYAYEYLGNSTRLVITPLTDRCYITLTQSLHLVMGGAPAGPAGTGKTETTKDLGRALGVMVYVFNCSEQMDYKSCANIYKGLAQTGAWGCFDEFNRISVEVLSVIAVQVKTIQEAIKMQKTVFMFMGETIKLAPTIGIFITMNPGYAGRTELPENLKALFRPCAMIVPDIALICEIMLMAEGFQDARRLARKFITLYTLCKELLSKQDHYDWGLRAIKSVLVVAGSLKRNDRNRPEEQVLMRALRDFNIPKIVTEDITIFTDLIGDLFPAVDIPRKRSLAFEKAIRRAIVELRLQPEEGFLMKVVQLEELLNVRHSVFIVGNAGTGKTKIWQTLLKTYSIQKLEPISNILNPKALTNDELFGIVNATTREWKDGLFSFIMRNQSNLENDNPKWIVLDGDIDPLWIESLNTLMDDNKILTLANNERITLRKTMRLLFEVGHLRAATPATVSRAGVLYINPQDLNWSSYVLSWLDTRENLMERSILNTLFERYYPKLIQREQRHTIPITEIAMIQTSCHLLECLLDEAAANQDYNEGESAISKASLSHGNIGSVDSLQLYITFIFIYATMWGFGSTLHEDHLISWRNEFHKWWITEFKDIKLPTHGTIFDYYFDLNTQQFVPWKELATQQQVDCLDLDKPLQETTIQTAETVRLTYFLKLLIGKNLPCMLLGTTGCGKGTIFRELFKNFTNLQEIKSKKRIPSPSLTRMVQTTQLNYYTTSEILQKTFERSLEKKPGKWYGPIGSKQRLIYFIRDFNMSKVDAYGTIRSHTIIRQFMDYEQWYDRQQLCLKNIHNCQFAVCMNPTSGSFTIDPRLQRHFCTFSLVEPNEESLQYIYGSILQLHLDNPHNTFGKDIKLIGNTLVKIGVSFHKRVKSLFLPTALKFHYTFNMRDLTNIYQNVVNTIGTMSSNEAATAITNTAALTNFNGTICSKPSDMIRLYVHEAFRVYHDRLVERCDMKSFKSAIRDFFKKDFEELDEDFVFSEPLIYCHFTQSLGDQKYMPITNWKSLYDLVTEAQTIYNDVIGHINLVLFEDALNHLCRINRVLESPSNNALLVGVGGSGKQTITRLASFISSMNVYQIQIRRNFGVQDMKDEISELYMKVGLKNVSSVLLISDAQISEESLLIYINDFLASGEIPDLFNDDQIENIINAIRNEVKQHGIQDTKENSWRFLVEKVKRLLKIVLCFSPVGRNFRLRARKFPAIINNTYIDWFHEWPSTALESVSQNFLEEISEEILPRQIIESISYFMAFVHDSVNQISTVYKQNERRFNYTTPKTFLEYIFLYRKLLIEKTDENRQRITRLKNGMAKLAECSQQVQNLKNQLAEQQIQLNAKNEATDKLIFVVTAESERVKNEKNIAHEEERRVRIIEEDVSIKTKVCEEDLRRAEPALVAAQAALNTLNKGNLTELKSFGSPPKAVVNVCSAVMVLLAIDGKIPHDRSWKAAKLMMVRIDQFLNDLINYNKENIHDNVIEVLQEYLQDPEFDPDKIVQKSVAAAGLCAWVINIYRYHQIFLLVGPKQKALKDSQEELRDARKRLHFLQLKIINLEKKLHNIQDELEEAVIAKQKCQQETDRTVATINTAHRLVNGLANENIRWKECVQSLIDNLSTLPGDMLLISSFLTYTGCFTKRYRKELQEKLWMPYFRNIQPSILHTDVDDHICLFTDDAQIAVWNNDGLPMDRMSMENATILTNSSRWPLMIDPQLQGIKWIKNTFGKTLIVLQLNEKNFLEKLEAAICNGSTVLIENIEEKIDTVLDPLLSRLLIKKNRYIRIADRELEYNASFRLILHTKLANPHYKPELQAQTTLINFTVTPDGLEEQLLAEVVKVERPDLEDMKSKLTVQQNKFKITLKELENELLARLASAGENILDDHDLVRNLESTKYTVNEIELKVNEARATSMQIDDARNLYRPAAKRAAELYFVLVDLGQINPMYKFSLKLYMHVFKQAISLTLPESRQEKRVTLLVNSITLQTFHYTLRALFEVDKLTFIAHMTLRLMASSMPICREEIDFLLRYPCDYSSVPPVDFINRVSWAGIKSLAMLEEFYGLDKDIECYHKHWRKYVVSSTPECEQLPGEWKNRSPLQRLCILRTLRPDRVSNAIRHFIEETMGKEYTTIKSHTFSDIFKDVTPNIPVIFVLSPGVDPIKDVENMAYKLGFNVESLINISLGQGQEILAEQAIAKALESNQKWVILQNIHLVKNWLPILDSEIQRISDANMSHTLNFRLFLTAEPAPDPKYHLIPQGILESSLKIINEPPSGLRENFLKAWSNFTEETLETCTQEAEFKSVLFALCFFHAVSSQRHKFGPLGWNKTYPFNMGDLTISASVLHNYLESSNRIPWEDLRYLFGEIMYGGHITNDWDRRLCHTYLEELLQQDLIDTDFQLCPGFCAPPNLDYLGYHDYITEMLPGESPALYGLHPNAEISFLTNTSERMLRTVFELQPRESELSAICGTPREELVKVMAEDFLEKLKEEFNIQSLLARIECKTSFVVVALQETERMNMLIREIKRSLHGLIKGLKGELTLTAEMERLDYALFYDHVPECWMSLAYPSVLNLQSWFTDLLHRIRELSMWLNDFKLPSSVWLGSLFNPQSFLTAIMQESARKQNLPLDRLCLHSDVTKSTYDDINLPPTDGAFVHGLYLEGASWSTHLNSIVSLQSKELFCLMPVIYLKSVVQEKEDIVNTYECPLYKTRFRNETYVWSFNLKSSERPSKWILGGVALLLQP